MDISVFTTTAFTVYCLCGAGWGAELPGGDEDAVGQPGGADHLAGRGGAPARPVSPSPALQARRLSPTHH